MSGLLRQFERMRRVSGTIFPFYEWLSSFHKLALSRYVVRRAYEMIPIY